MTVVQRQIQARLLGCRIECWDAVLDEFEPTELAMVLRLVWDDLPDDQRSWALSTAWTGAAGGPLDVIPTEWLTMFRAVGYIDELWAGVIRPPEQITLYRGGIRIGMAWTADRERAEWFQDRYEKTRNARRFLGESTDWIEPSKLWTATVGPDRLLARFHNLHRGEDEYVIDPTGLTVEEET